MNSIQLNQITPLNCILAVFVVHLQLLEAVYNAIFAFKKSGVLSLLDLKLGVWGSILPILPSSNASGVDKPTVCG